MYHYANRPGLSTQRSRQVIAEFYNTSTNGLPGNDGTSYELFLSTLSCAQRHTPSDSGVYHIKNSAQGN